MFMASADELYITIKGKGGHAAIPEKTLNPVHLSAKIITSLYNYFDSTQETPSVFSFV